MMRTIKCVKLDFMKSTSLVKFMGLFLVIAGAITFFAADTTPSFGALYMIFGALCVCSNNFFATGGAEISTLVLPVTAGNRVFGRYLYGVLLLTLCAAAGLAFCVLTMVLRKVPMEKQLAEVALTLLYLGVGYIVLALQFLFLYLTRMKNAQILSLVRMIPAFVMFFGMNAIVEETRKGAELGLNLELLQKTISWCVTHPMTLAFSMLAAGLAAIMVCALISWMSEKKRY